MLSPFSEIAAGNLFRLRQVCLYFPQQRSISVVNADAGGHAVTPQDLIVLVHGPGK